jgi:hypothetical protein
VDHVCNQNSVREANHIRNLAGNFQNGTLSVQYNKDITSNNTYKSDKQSAPHLRRRLRGPVGLSGGQAPQPVRGATGDARSRRQTSPERPRRRAAGAEERHAPPTWLPCRRREGGGRVEEGSHGRRGEKGEGFWPACAS